jgi:hypothetical protein
MKFKQKIQYKKEDSKHYNRNQKNKDQIWSRNKMMPNAEGLNLKK